MDIGQILQAGQNAGLPGAPNKPGVGTPQPATGASEDAVALSPEAVFLNQLDQGGVEWGRAFSTLPPIPRTFNEIRDWVNEYNDGLRSRVEQIFQQRNVRLDAELSLQLDTQGTLQADQNHPQAQAAQQALDQHPELAQLAQEQGQRQQLAAVLGLGGRLRTADTAQSRQASEQALSQQLNHPQPYRLAVAATTAGETQQALQA